LSVLTFLQVRDFAIVDSVEVELAGGLTALTGETGAGKSILVDAVILALGGRATADMVRHGAERAEITATFDIGGNPEALAWLAEQSLEHDGEVILRRVVGADGRSRLYVNGQTLPATVVRELGALLIDIHGQQEFISLVRRDAQRRLVDEHGGHAELLAPVREVAGEWRRLQREHDALAAAAQERGSRLELLRYQVGELEALALEPGEVEALAAEQTRLANRGRLAEATRAALALAYDADGTDAHSTVSRALGQLRIAAELDVSLRESLRLLDEAAIALKEAGHELAGYLDSLEVDPARQDWVERRVAAIEELARKHRVPATALGAQLETLRSDLGALENSEVTLAGLQRQLAEARTRYDAAAVRLSQARRRAAGRLAGAVTGLMAVLGMPGGRFAIEVGATATAEPLPDGNDEVAFLVSANPGQPVRPVAKVASGGELSRISLAVQVAAAHGSSTTCMIFDEVDAGVGGAVAEMVGRQLAELGARGQVLCVTHLAQVASQADHQVRVSKLTDGRTSRMTVTELSAGERVEELARMLGGVEITRRARDHAREMLKAAAAARTG
jgi:DNA repair protein RecN (Recombination protein N)